MPRKEVREREREGSEEEGKEKTEQKGRGNREIANKEERDEKKCERDTGRDKESKKKRGFWREVEGAYYRGKENPRLAVKGRTQELCPG